MVSNKERESQPVENLGISKKDLMPRVMQRVIEIYAEVAGSEMAAEYLEEYGPEYFCDQTLESFENGWPVEYRFGSRLTGHSKLCVDEAWGHNDWDEDGERWIKFRFDPNLMPEERKGKKEADAEAIKEEFKRRVGEFLVAEGIAKRLASD